MRYSSNNIFVFVAMMAICGLFGVVTIAPVDRQITKSDSFLDYPSRVFVPTGVPSVSLEYDGIPDGDPTVHKVVVLGHVAFLEGHYYGWRAVVEGLVDDFSVREADYGPWKGRGIMLVPRDRYYELGYMAGAEQCRRRLEDSLTRSDRESVRFKCAEWLRQHPHPAEMDDESRE